MLWNTTVKLLKGGLLWVTCFVSLNSHIWSAQKILSCYHQAPNRTANNKQVLGCFWICEDIKVRNLKKIQPRQLPSLSNVSNKKFFGLTSLTIPASSQPLSVFYSKLPEWSFQRTRMLCLPPCPGRACRVKTKIQKIALPSSLHSNTVTNWLAKK